MPRKTQNEDVLLLFHLLEALKNDKGGRVFTFTFKLFLLKKIKKIKNNAHCSLRTILKSNKGIYR